MKLRPFLNMQQVFRLADGRGAKFLYENKEKPGPCPIALIRDGSVYNYNEDGQHLGNAKSPLNVVSALPPANWSVGMQRCIVGQTLMLRDYSFVTFEGLHPRAASKFAVRRETGEIEYYNHNGWAAGADNENDVIAIFDHNPGAPYKLRITTKSIEHLLARLRTAFGNPDKAERELEYIRVRTGVTHLLSQIKE